MKDPTGYQVEIAGQTIMIVDLDKDQLIQQLVSAFDALEEIDELHEKIGIQMRNWRYGRN